MSKISKADAVSYLGITLKEFNNYFNLSKEISGEKIRGRWYFERSELIEWKQLKDSRTINLARNDYEKCFEFAIRMAYGGMSLHGIRGQRSEVQAADDVILGILAEHALQQFLKSKFSTIIKLDEDVHTTDITPQDIDFVIENGVSRRPKIGVGVKASKMKNAFLVLGANEVESSSRKSDVYVFVRVGLPSDHLFRILREHSFFKNAKDLLEQDDQSRKIEPLDQVPVWICGFVSANDLKKVTSIPGQEFTNGHRYVKSVSKLRNSDKDWGEFVKQL